VEDGLMPHLMDEAGQLGLLSISIPPGGHSWRTARILKPMLVTEKS